jgi:hypothetical protein
MIKFEQPNNFLILIKEALAGKISGPRGGFAGGSFDFSRSFGYFSIMGKVTPIQFVRKITD